MIIYVVIFIIIIIILYNNTDNITNKENYDSIAPNINSIETCADIASSLYGTSGFGYNETNKNCYVSKTPLTRPIIQVHPYHNMFTKDDIVCNKSLFMRSLSMIADNTMIGNRLYMCYNKSNVDDDYDKYYFQKNQEKKLITSQDISKLPITYHNFFEIDWPIEKSELNNLIVKLGSQNSKQDIRKLNKLNDANNLFIDWKRAK